MLTLWPRIRGYCRRTTSRVGGRRNWRLGVSSPTISFSFDDFPRNALEVGGRILESHGLSGTYYASLGLMGQETVVGRIFIAEDLPDLVGRGHELGCHTFDHYPAWETSPRRFKASIIRNQEALRRILPGTVFKTMSYPISCPRPGNKLIAARFFDCCRNGGQTYNRMDVDLNQLSAYFLEQSRGDLGAVKRVVDDTCRASGWLIFATHDVSERPTPLGCRTEFFEEVVRYAVASGARIMPVFQAFRLVCDFSEKRGAAVA